jgi:hypothetical protein
LDSEKILKKFGDDHLYKTVKHAKKKTDDIEAGLKTHTVFIKNNYKSGWPFERTIYSDIEAENFYLFDKDMRTKSKDHMIRVIPQSKTHLDGVPKKHKRSGTQFNIA